MKRLAWLTDLHLEFAPDKINDLCNRIKAAEPDYILIGGDTGIASSVEQYLLILEEQLQLPIYFVLGNHDFYYGSIEEVRKRMVELSNLTQRLQWLAIKGIVELTENTALIGHDGWADGRLGNGIKSTVQLNDYLLIKELIEPDIIKRFKKLNELGDEAAEYIKRILPAALEKYRSVFLLTHVPPFKDACTYRGRITDDEFLPHFSCKSVGDVIIEIMKDHPHGNLTVLCGHTHGKGEAQILSNLYVKAAGAEYGNPRLQEVIEVE